MDAPQKKKPFVRVSSFRASKCRKSYTLQINLVNAVRNTYWSLRQFIQSMIFVMGRLSKTCNESQRYMFNSARMSYFKLKFGISRRTGLQAYGCDTIADDQMVYGEQSI